MENSTLLHINYRSATGEIYSDNADIQKDLDETLNLNAERHLLKANRKETLNRLVRELSRMKSKGNWNRRMLESVKSTYEKYDAEGKRKEFAGVALWYLNKQIIRNVNK